jgi:hypothetical protein
MAPRQGHHSGPALRGTMSSPATVLQMGSTPSIPSTTYQDRPHPGDQGEATPA